MFKVGDKVKCIDTKGLDHLQLTVDKIYEVLGIGIWIEQNPIEPYVTIINDNGNKVEYYSYRFKLVKKELHTETDFLDAFQQNFKDGV